MKEDDLKGGAIRGAKKEEIKVPGIPTNTVPETPAIREPPRSAIRSIKTPNLVQPHISELHAPLVQYGLPSITKRSNGKGAHYDSAEVRHHMVHSLGRHPKLLRAYLNSSVI